MSRTWLWDQKDDLRVIDWVVDEAKRSLLDGNSFIASEIFTGAGNFFALKNMVLQKRSQKVDDWIWEINAGIYDGILRSGPEPTGVNRSVLKCFRLLNSFFELNGLNDRMKFISAPAPDLIIPEPYEDDGIIE